MLSVRNLVFFTIYLALNPKYLVGFFKGLYLPIFIQFYWLKKYGINTVIDIGAYTGEVSLVLKNLFPNASIYAFEPIKQNVEIIKRKLDYPKVFVNQIALSNKKSKTSFFLNDYVAGSSLLPINQQATKIFPYLAKQKKIIVQTDTLDNFFKNKKLAKKILLKIDTQGTEKKVLEGGKNLLKNVYMIHIEVAFQRIYQNQDKFSDVYNFLNSSGFRYLGEVGESQFYPLFGLGISANSIFINTKFE